MPGWGNVYLNPPPCRWRGCNQSRTQICQPFNFTNHATFLFAANELPGSSAVTGGFFSRWLVVPFTGYFPEGVADRTLPYRLLNEVEGVIVKAMPALQRLLERGAFEVPTSMLAAF